MLYGGSLILTNFDKPFRIFREEFHKFFLLDGSNNEGALMESWWLRLFYVQYPDDA